LFLVLIFICHAAHLLGMATNIPLAILVVKEKIPLERYFGMAQLLLISYW
jgi:hypothetical protein